MNNDVVFYVLILLNLIKVVRCIEKSNLKQGQAVQKVAKERTKEKEKGRRQYTSKMYVKKNNNGQFSFKFPIFVSSHSFEPKICRKTSLICKDDN